MRGFPWTGARGRFTATLNGEMVMRETADTRYRIGQFQCGITLRPSDNLLVFQVEELDGLALLSALITGPNNDGDTAEQPVVEVVTCQDRGQSAIFRQR